MRMLRSLRAAVLAAVAAAVVAAGGWRQAAPAPLLVLVSLDGWRWDYLDRAGAPALRALAARGVRAEGLIPTFPSKTFPSHYTIVTGLRPARHGILSNNMRDPAIHDRFALAAPSVRDPRWWSGEPVWVTAVRQGRRSATLFWPGSDVNIGGFRPSEWRLFDDDLPHAERVRQILAWLDVPDARRPAFVTLYFSELDTAGHDHGPDSPEAMAAAAALDRVVGDLVAGIDRLGLTGRTTFAIVSDHGMSALAEERTIFLDDYLDPAAVDVVDWSPVLHAWPGVLSADTIYQALAGRHPALAVYRRDEIPAFLQFSGHPRIAPVVGLAEDGWRITTRDRFERRRAEGRVSKGDHGYDPRFRSMHGLFVAAGPGLRQAAVVPAFENVHLYEFMCRVLGLTPAPNDGDPSVTRPFFLR